MADLEEIIAAAAKVFQLFHNQDPIPRRFLGELLSPFTFDRLAGSAAARGSDENS